jgi:hypothetical protein
VGVTGDSVAGIGVDGDDNGDGDGVAEQHKGKRTRWLYSLRPRRSSNSLRCFLVFLCQWWLDSGRRCRRWCSRRGYISAGWGYNDWRGWVRRSLSRSSSSSPTPSTVAVAAPPSCGVNLG